MGNISESSFRGAFFGLIVGLPWQLTAETTIFALSIKNLGPLTKRASSLRVMAILGGAVLPAIMGRISDTTNIRTAFVVPLVCYVYIFYFAASGYKPSNNPSEESPSMAQMAQES
jgi:fucose permease